MIAVKADKDRVEITLPTDGMTPEEVNDFVSWLRVESIVRRSKLVRSKPPGNWPKTSRPTGGPRTNIASFRRGLSERHQPRF